MTGTVPGQLRVAVVAESFLPEVNGVVNSVLRILDHLRRQGHEALVIAPAVPRRARTRTRPVTRVSGFPVVRVPAVYLPRIESLPVGVPVPRVLSTLRRFRPDVVHLASPFVLGAGATVAARLLRLPTVAVYQTDVPGYVDQYDLGPLIPPARAGAWGLVRLIHNSAAVTLAPSSATIRELEDHGVRRVDYWPRGVDAELFSPARRSPELRRHWFGGSPEDRRLVGYVGRLASEKNVQRLAALAHRDDVQLVIVGDGPERERLRTLMPDAVFTGELHGTRLAEAYASLDVFVHTGEFETFCQGLQEALACGVPAVAPAAGGPLDLITPGVNGELLAVDRFTADLPGAVDRLSGPRGRVYGRAARAGVLHRTWPAVCGDLTRVYRNVVTGAREARVG